MRKILTGESNSNTQVKERSSSAMGSMLGIAQGDLRFQAPNLKKKADQVEKSLPNISPCLQIVSWTPMKDRQINSQSMGSDTILLGNRFEARNRNNGPQALFGLAPSSNGGTNNTNNPQYISAQFHNVMDNTKKLHGKSPNLHGPITRKFLGLSPNTTSPQKELSNPGNKKSMDLARYNLGAL